MRVSSPASVYKYRDVDFDHMLAVTIETIAHNIMRIAKKVNFDLILRNRTRFQVNRSLMSMVQAIKTAN